MESMKKFRIGSGLQNFHIRTPLVLLQPLRWRCVKCVNRDLYCCLLSRCEALRTCCSGFSIATVLQQKVFAVLYNAVRAGFKTSGAQGLV